MCNFVTATIESLKLIPTPTLSTGAEVSFFFTKLPKQRSLQSEGYPWAQALLSALDILQSRKSVRAFQFQWSTTYTRPAEARSSTGSVAELITND